MSALARILRGACLAAGIAATAAQAGGPLGVCNLAPLKYSPASVTLNYDGGGMLGLRTKAQADAIVNSAIALWNDVPTATITLSRGVDLPVDVTSALLPSANSYLNYLDNFGDAYNPVIYDSDGSIIDAILGLARKAARSVSQGPPTTSRRLAATRRDRR